MNWIEITGFVLGIVGVFLTIIEHPGCFPAGILSVTASFIIFKEQGLYSNALLQLLFLVLLVYGWWNWLRKRPTGPIQVSVLENGQIWILLSAGIATGMVLGWFFSKQPGVQVPYMDGIITGISIVAQWMVAKKKIENWIFWIAVNVMSICLYFYTGLYWYSILYFVYLIMAIKGWQTWKLSLIKNESR